MLAGLEGGDGLPRMQRGGDAEVHELHVRIGQKFGQGAVSLDIAAEVEIAGAGDVAGHPAQNTVHRQADGIADSHQPGRLELLIRLDMGHAHEAEADDSHVHFADGGCRSIG